MKSYIKHPLVLWALMTVGILANSVCVSGDEARRGTRKSALIRPLPMLQANGVYVRIHPEGSIESTRARNRPATPSRSRRFVFVRSMAYGKGLFVMVGAHGTLLTSIDTVSWTDRSDPRYPCFSEVEYARDQFVAVGSGGSLFTSPNGLNWARQPSPEAADLNGLAFGCEAFVAAGDRGTILVSADGRRWAKAKSGTRRNLKSIHYRRGRFVAKGCGGLRLISGCGHVWLSIEKVAPALAFSVWGSKQ
jgi:hypothetical protein